MVFKNNRWLQYLSVVTVTIILLGLEVHVGFLARGLLATPFLVVVAASAIIGDFISSILALVLGTVAVNYVTHPVGFNFNSATLFKSLEFFVSGVVIYLLALRGNRFQQNNSKLMTATTRLQNVIQKLKNETKGNKEQIARLNTMNTELKSLVDEFMADDAYWARKWPIRSGNQGSKRRQTYTKHD